LVLERRPRGRHWRLARSDGELSVTRVLQTRMLELKLHRAELVQ